MKQLTQRIFCASALAAAALNGDALAKDESIKLLEGHRAPTEAAEFHPGGAQVASAGRDGVVQLWNLRIDKSLWTHDYESPLRALAFTADGEQLACGGGGFARGEDGRHTEHKPVGEIELLDVATGEVAGGLKGHVGLVTGILAHPDGVHLVSCAHDGFVIVWDLAAGKPARKLPRAGTPIDSIAISPDGELVAVPSGGVVRLYEVASGEQLREIVVDEKAVFAVAFSPDGKLLATGSKSAADAGKVALWDVATGELKVGGEPEPLASYNDIVFSPDGKLLVTSSSTSGAVEVRDPSTTELRTTFSGHTEALSSVGFSPNGKVIVSTAYDKTVRFWRAPL